LFVDIEARSIKEVLSARIDTGDCWNWAGGIGVLGLGGDGMKESRDRRRAGAAAVMRNGESDGVLGAIEEREKVWRWPDRAVRERYELLIHNRSHAAHL
jgi:hypothetical protein